MSEYRIAQSSRAEDDGWWQWAVWIEARPAELDLVRSVTWYLHPTFLQPVQEKTSRADKFRLDESGWGEFTLRARLNLADGSSVELRHELELRTEEGGSAPQRSAPRKEERPRWRSLATEAPEMRREPGAEAFAVEDRPARGVRGRQPRGTLADWRGEERKTRPSPLRVYFASSPADEDVAGPLREQLRQKGIQVIGPHDSPPGTFLNEGLDRQIAGSDAVVAVQSELPGGWVDVETEAAREQKKPVLLVQIGEPGSAEAAKQGLVVHRTGGVAGIKKASESLLRSLSRLKI